MLHMCCTGISSESWKVMFGVFMVASIDLLGQYWGYRHDKVLMSFKGGGGGK